MSPENVLLLTATDNLRKMENMKLKKYEKSNEGNEKNFLLVEFSFLLKLDDDGLADFFASQMNHDYRCLIRCYSNLFLQTKNFFDTNDFQRHQ